MANDALVVDTVAALLEQELVLDVLQLTYSLPSHRETLLGDHNSVLIVIDDGESNTSSPLLPPAWTNEGPVLLMTASVRLINLDLQQDYPLAHPHLEQLTNLIREFSRNYLRGTDAAFATWAA
jgi:hypothetical protein